MNAELKRYYLQQGPLTDPDDLAWALEGIPCSVPEAVKAIQGSVLHIFWAERYGVKLDEARKSEVNIRRARKKLDHLQTISPGPLGQPRAAEQRLVGNCRDFTVLSVSLLRKLGIPARSRCGFGTYFIPGHYEDHWVFEYWDEDGGRWVMADAQMDPLQREVLRLDFDPLDMPPGEFITGGEAWILARSGQAQADDFGIFEWKGIDFIKGNLIRDALALLKVELLPWDWWGIVERPYASLEAQEIEDLDRLAEAARQGDTERVRALVEAHPDYAAPPEWAG